MPASVQLGKLGCQDRLNAVGPGNLVHVKDQLSDRRFLVDTGASLSLFPSSSAAAPSGPRLIGPAGQPIPCWGERVFTLFFFLKLVDTQLAVSLATVSTVSQPGVDSGVLSPSSS